MPPDRFPLALLEQPVSQRLAYFQGYTMAHPRLVDTAHQLLHAIYRPSGTSLIFIFGPTGVGKSTLLRRICQKIIADALPDLDNNSSRIPIAGLEVIAPEFSDFSWKDFYLRALKALQEPMLEHKVNPTDTKLKLRMALEHALHYRQLDAFYIDEAQNLAKVASGRRLRDQTDCIKSLASLSGVPFLLCGTYELLMLRNLSAQLCRRSIDIHLCRYRAESEADLKVFQSVVQTFQQHLPFSEIPALLPAWEFFYERSIGCVGILKDWLARTLCAVLDSNPNARTCTMRQLESHAWSAEHCLLMLAEAREHERLLLERDTAGADLRLALGLQPMAHQQCSSPAQASEAPQPNRVGQPFPKRRPVGAPQDN